MSFSLVFTRASNPPPLPPLLVRLFSVYDVVPIIVPFLGCVRLSGHVLWLLLFSFSFLCGFLFLLVREKHRKTLYRFLFRKIKSCKSTTQGGGGVKFITQTDKNRVIASGRQKYCSYLILGSNTWNLHYYSQLDKIIDTTRNDYGLSL